MSTEKYRSLIDRICELSKIPDPASMYETASLQVKGVNFSLFDGGIFAPQSMIVYCDFGALPDHARETVLLRLLETNLYLFGANCPTFTFNPENRHIILASRVFYERATAPRLLELLAHYAEMALEWRKTYFLLDEAQEPTTAASASGVGKGRRLPSHFASLTPSAQEAVNKA